MRLFDLALVAGLAAVLYLAPDPLMESFARWESAYASPRTDQALVEQAGVFDSHQSVYQQVGSESAWEQHVKPTFTGRVIARMVQDLGTGALDQARIDGWLQENQEWIRSTLQTVGDEYVAEQKKTKSE